FASSVPLFMIVEKNFMPNDDQSEFDVNLRAPEGTSLEATEVVVNRVAAAIRARLPEDVAYTLVTIAGDQASTRNSGTIYVRLKPIEDRRDGQVKIMNLVRTEVLPPLSANLRTAVQQVAMVGGGGSQAAAGKFGISGPGR